MYTHNKEPMSREERTAANQHTPNLKTEEDEMNRLSPKELQSTKNKILSMRDGNQCLVKLSLVLHITSPSRETLLQTPKYVAQVLTVVTSSRHHPKHGVRQDITDVRITYDSLGNMVCLDVDYIEEGIYRIVSSADIKPHSVFKGLTIRETQFIWTETTDVIPPDSRFIIIGELSQVPVPNKNASRAADCPLRNSLLDYLHTTTFRDFTLPMLLSYGEVNLWSGIEGCADVSPVVLPGKPDYRQWKWLGSVKIMSMKTTISNKNTYVEEPSVIPDDVPFCHYIYKTYISGDPKSDVRTDTCAQIYNDRPVSEVDVCGSSDKDTDSDEQQSPNRTKTQPTSSDNKRVNRKVRRHRKNIYSKRRKYRFALDVKSLCKTSGHRKEENLQCNKEKIS